MKVLGISLAILFAAPAFAGSRVVLDPAKSKIEWVGTKVLGKHNGTVPLKKGALEFEGNLLKGGSFEVDIEKLDVADLEGEYKTKLTNHLKSPDFFDTAKHKTATVTITDVVYGKGGVYDIVADLTIKGIKAPVTFKATSSEGKDEVTFNSKITFNRLKYKIEYNSETIFGKIGDKAINDNVEVAVNLVAPKPPVAVK